MSIQNTTHNINEKNNSAKHVFIIVVSASVVSLLLTNSYFNFVLQKQCHSLENEFNKLRTDVELTKSIVFNVTDSLAKINYDFLQKQFTFSATEDGKESLNLKRKKRHVAHQQSHVAHQQPITSTGRDGDKIERTLYSLRREMFSLNDRLRILLRYGSNGNGNRDAGAAGPPGPIGKTGSPGVPGVNGRDGLHGAQGVKGPRGAPGAMGPEGSSGKDGQPGVNGIPGIPGYPGEKGEKGQRGREGRNGIQGLPGATGREGNPGRSGKQGIKGEPGVCSCVEKDEIIPVEDTTIHAKPASDVVYTIWGSSTCPYSSDMIYSGQLSSSMLTTENIFSGSDPICLPGYKRARRAKRQVEDDVSTPKGPPSPKNKDIDDDFAEITEPDYEFTTIPPTTSDQPETTTDAISDEYTTEDVLTTTSSPSTSQTSPNKSPSTVSNNNFSFNATTTTATTTTTTTKQPTTSTPSVSDEPDFVYARLTGTRKYVPCAICNARSKSAKLVLPGKTQCPVDWSFEYSGYLMNYHHGTKNSHLLCVYDQALGVSPSSDVGIRQIISTYMSHVKISCDSFQCPPWSEDLMKCVVCSK